MRDGIHYGGIPRVDVQGPQNWVALINSAMLGN